MDYTLTSVTASSVIYIPVSGGASEHDDSKVLINT